MFSFIGKMSFVGKILAIGILATGCTYIYSLCIDYHLKHTYYEYYTQYSNQYYNMTDMLPSETIMIDTYSTTIKLITQQEIDAIDPKTHLIEPYNDSEILDTRDSIQKNKAHAISEGVYLYCYQRISENEKNRLLSRQQKINSFCEKKGITQERASKDIINQLQKISDFYLEHVKTRYEILHKFPFVDTVRYWEGDDFLRTVFTLFIILGIWELLVFIYAKK